VSHIVNFSNFASHEIANMSSSSENSDMVKQPIRESRFYKHRLYKLLHKKLRIPQKVVQPFRSALKIAVSPAQYRLRKRLAREIVATTKSLITIPDRDGYRFFGPEDIQEIDGIVKYCATVYQKAREAFPSEYFQKHPHKKFLFPILEGVEFCRHPALLRLMVSRPIVDAAAAYLGTVPKLTGARLCWSPENETARSSQLFHFDYEDLRQVKVFINIFETKEDQGPLTFLPANISEQVQKSIGRVLGRVQDERIYEGGGRNHELKLIGLPGSGAFLDTSRCLHYGSRFNRRDRLVLIIQFLNFYSSFRPTAPFKVPPDLPGFTPDLVQKLALGIH
jgi:hypothetical protein